MVSWKSADIPALMASSLWISSRHGALEQVLAGSHLICAALCAWGILS